MFNSTSVVLNPARQLIDISGVSPLTLTINPQFVEPSSKVYKIEYLFDDGSETLVRKLTVNPDQSDFSLPFPLEPGDPRNFTETHNFVLQKEDARKFVIHIRIYSIINQVISENYNQYTINLKLLAPVLYSVDANKKNYFKDIHLISTRMFGPDNTILYNFESFSPQYFLPTIVKWHKPYNETNPPPFLFDPANSIT